jgi:hypothetical protein
VGGTSFLIELPEKVFFLELVGILQLVTRLLYLTK